MRNSKNLFFISLAVLAGSYGFAGQPDSAPVNTKAISWEELQSRCLHPEDTDVQRAPQNIKLQCTDQSKEFVPTASKAFSTPGVRKVTTAVYSDKFHVSADVKEIATVQSAGSCLALKEVVKSISIERPLNCAEVIGLKGSPDDLCVAALDNAKGSNPKLVEVQETGNVVDTCSGMISAAGK